MTLKFSRVHFVEDKIIKYKNLSIAQGCIEPWNTPYYQSKIIGLLEHQKEDINTPWNKLKDTTRKIILWGSKKEISFNDLTTGKKEKEVFEGVIKKTIDFWTLQLHSMTPFKKSSRVGTRKIHFFLLCTIILYHFDI